MFRSITFILIFLPCLAQAIDNQSFNALVSQPATVLNQGVFSFVSDVRELKELSFKSTGGVVVRIQPEKLHSKYAADMSFESYWSRYHNFSLMNVNPNIEFIIFYNEDQRVQKLVIESTISEKEAAQRGLYAEKEYITLSFNYIYNELSSVNLLRFWDNNAFKANNKRVTATMMRIDSKEADVFLSKATHLFAFLKDKNISSYAEGAQVDYLQLQKDLSFKDKLSFTDKVLSFFEQSNVYNNKAKQADFIVNKELFKQTGLYSGYRQNQALQAGAFGVVAILSSLFYVEANAITGMSLSLALANLHFVVAHYTNWDNRKNIRLKDLNLKTIRNSIKRSLYIYSDLLNKIKMSVNYKFRLLDANARLNAEFTSWTHQPRHSTAGESCRLLF